VDFYKSDGVSRLSKQRLLGSVEKVVTKGVGGCDARQMSCTTLQVARITALERRLFVWSSTAATRRDKSRCTVEGGATRVLTVFVPSLPEGEALVCACYMDWNARQPSTGGFPLPPPPSDRRASRQWPRLASSSVSSGRVGIVRSAAQRSRPHGCAS
jgi:hypothetical protein